MPPAVASAPGMRWRIPVVLAVTVFVNFLDRNNLALALPRIAEDFGWTDRQLGEHGQWLLAAFFLSYAFANVWLSPLAERFGPKRSVMLAIVAFSVFTLLSAPLGQSLAALIGLRLLLGLGEGVHIPMLSAITSRWFPAEERSRANAIWGAGITLAVALAPLLIVRLIHAIGWRPTFAVLGLGGLLVSLPLVSLLVQDEPRKADGVSDRELSLIQAGQVEFKRAAPSVDEDIWRDQRFWLLVLSGILNAFCAFGTLNWLPSYFNRAKGIDFERLGWPLALVFLAGIAGMALMAYLGDRLQRRILLASGGFLLTGVMVFVASSMQRLDLLVGCFAIAVFCQSAFGAQEYALVQRLLPADRVGAGTGLYNGLAVLFGGVGGSLIPGEIVAMTGSFDTGIFSIVVGALLASLVLLRLAKLMPY